MERTIQIRSLDDESTTISIASDCSIGDLKVILKESFPPATKSPNFHLFFKGAKLSLESCINSIESSEFIVLVPFAKKTRQPPASYDLPGHSKVSANSSQGDAASSAADSAWLDMMNDLSYMSAFPSNCSSLNDLGNGVQETFVGESSMECSINTKRKRELFDGGLILHDILCSGSGTVFDREISDRIRQVVESVNCLSHAEKGTCLLLEEFFSKSRTMDQCVCPQWLKRVLKSFTFFNIFYGFVQVRGQYMTRGYLEEALKQGKHFGLDDDANISDAEKLAILCPKIVIMLNKEENIVSKLGSAIIIRSSTEADYQCESTIKNRTARKQAPTSSIIKSITNRSYALRTILWMAIKCSMCKAPLETCSPPMPSLEDLITLLSRGIASSKGSKVKSVKTRSLVSRCCGTSKMEPTEMIEHLRKGVGVHGQIVHVEEIAAKLAVHAELPNVLSEASETVLEGIGISRLYSHQAEAIQALLSGKNVLVSTSTSSGKSLCYNLPVLETLSQNLLSCALYIFPTKALAQDQLRAFIEMTRFLNVPLNVGIYDGDTSQEQRSWIRDNARLLITNPDMLHMSILPYHGQFQRILSNLRFIMLDETHTYKGAFGCHTAFVLRRLRRICFHVYGSDPSFIFSTATSTNPREHAMELANLQTLELIHNDGSPCGPKHFLLWNPPLRPLNESKTSSRNEHLSVTRDLSTKRSSPILEVSNLFAEMVQHGLRCITFCKTRKLTELVLIHTREILQETAPDLVDCICVYRGGYTPQDRRRIETDFFGGKLRGVAATNALELGVDVGHIDATLHLGFPGSVASLWQQAGRSGRRLKPSLAIYVAFEGPLDQYFMKFPHKLFQRSIEHCHVDVQNQKVYSNWCCSNISPALLLNYHCVCNLMKNILVPVWIVQ